MKLGALKEGERLRTGGSRSEQFFICWRGRRPRKESGGGGGFEGEGVEDTRIPYPISLASSLRALMDEWAEGREGHDRRRPERERHEGRAGMIRVALAHFTHKRASPRWAQDAHQHGWGEHRVGT
eukprot:scaffold171517_cov22-Tisochrysis_lutea.AAC.1